MNGGTSWSAQSLPAAGTGVELAGVACPSSGDCYIVSSGGATGIIFATVNGGSTWVSQAVPAAIDSLQAISCESTLDCVAVGQSPEPVILSTSNGGTTWTSEAVPAKVELIQDVDCEPAFCVAVGEGSFAGTSDLLLTSTDGGTTWTAYGVGSDAAGGGLSDVACTSTSDCLATDGSIYETNDTGSVWTEQTLPTGPVGLTSIACPSVTECFTTDDVLGPGTDQIGVTTNGGASWSSQAIPAVFLHDVACPSTTDCVAVGDAGNGTAATLTTDDAGTTWVSEPNPDTDDGGVGLLSISCPSTSVCFATGDGTLITTDNGGVTWTALTFPSVISPLNAIACPTTLDCYMVGGSTPTGEIEATTNGGATWTSQTVPEAMEGLHAISCSSPTVCLASGEEDAQDAVILGTSNAGTTWVAESIPSNVVNVASLTCPTATDCIALSQSGPMNSADGGAAWQLETGTGIVDATLVPIACTTLTCFAVGSDSGGGVVYSSVSPAASEPTVTALSPASGPTAGGVAVTLTGTNYSTAPGGTTVDFGSLPASAVSCSSQTTCTATSPAGSAGTVNVTATTSAGTSPTGSSNAFTFVAPTPPPSPTHGYWLVGSDGGIFTFGSAQFYGSTGNITLQRPVVGITPAANRQGYWLVASDGGIFAFGTLGFYGSIPGLGYAPAGSASPKRLAAPIVGMVPSPDGGGYFMVASDGGVFAFGDANFAGSCPGIGGCSGAAVAVMPDASGNGYWLVTATGNVYDFGDAANFGAPGPQGSPVTSAVRTPNGGGYWILLANGNILGYGNATDYGNAAGQFGGSNPASAIFAVDDGGGYWLASANGVVATYGDAPNDGSMAGTKLNGPIIAATGF